jgi:ribosomal protein L7/L12
MADLQKIIDDPSQLTVIKAAERAKMMEEKWSML